MATQIEIQQWEILANIKFAEVPSNVPQLGPPGGHWAIISKEDHDRVISTIGEYCNPIIKGTGGRQWTLYHSTNGLVWLSTKFDKTNCYLSPPTESVGIKTSDDNFIEVNWLTGKPFVCPVCNLGGSPGGERVSENL